jgi:hypothetical protein
MSLLSSRALEHSEELMFLYYHFKQTLFLHVRGLAGFTKAFLIDRLKLPTSRQD